ncbi:MAG: hypothetical protein V5A46_08990 [Haloferacaceae archaeon]
MTARDSKSGQSINSVPLILDDTLEAISNHRRRFVIRSVDEMAIPVETDDLADQLTKIRNDPPRKAQDRKREYVALTQHHLPKLDELGAVAFDKRTKALMPSPATRKLAMLIRLLELLCTGEK